MSFAWLAVIEGKRGDAVEAQRVEERVAATLPGFTPTTLLGLFDVYIEPLSTDAPISLRGSGLLPPT